MYNVLYIHTHDTGRWNSVYGKQTPTPALMEFAKDSVTFRNAFCVSPTCSPSRGALLTGCYPHQNGLIGLAHRGFSITNTSTHLAAFLSENGFETVLSGIQHEQGQYTGGKDTEENSRKLGYKVNISYVGDEYDKFHRCDQDEENSKRVVSYLDNVDKNKPFFLSFGMFETHRPYPELPENYPDMCNPDYVQVPNYLYDSPESREDIARFNYSLKRFDENFARVIDALKRNNLFDNTIIISTTDHGMANPFAKCTLSDDGLGVYLIMRIPGYEKTKGKLYDGLVSHLDVFPTLCDALGIKQAEWLEGKSLLPVFEDEKEDDSKAIYGEINFHTSYEPARCVRTKRYKYIRYYDNEWNKYNLSNCDDSQVKTKLVESGWREKEKQNEYLFDLYFDPSEKENLVGNPEYETTLNNMRQMLNDWQEKTKDEIVNWQEYKGLCKLNRRDCLSASCVGPDDLDSIIEKK